MFSILKHVFNLKKSNLIKRINKYIKMSKTLIPFIQSPYQNRTDLGRLGDWTKGFMVNKKNKDCRIIDRISGQAEKNIP